MATVRDLQKILKRFEEKPESCGFDLRLSLAELIMEKLDERGWTQKQLAARAGMKQPFVTRILHSDSNCTFEVAGRLLFALGVRPRISEREEAFHAVQYGKASHEILMQTVTTNVQDEINFAYRGALKSPEFNLAKPSRPTGKAGQALHTDT